MGNSVEPINSYKIKFPFITIVIYAMLGALWIFFTDQLLGRIFATSAYFVGLSMAKGWLFIFYTALVLYLLLSQELKKLNKSQDALQLSERRFRAMFEMAAVGMAQTEPSTGRWQHVNQKLAEITGYSIQEMEGRRFSEITHPEDRELDWRNYQALVHGEKPEYHNEKRYIRKDGTIVWVNVNINMVYDESGQPLHTLAVVEDITVRKQAEEDLSQYNQELQEAAQELEQSRNMLQLILESIPVRVFWKDSALRYLGCNTAFARDAGFSHPSELVGKDDFGMGWPEQAERYREDDRRVMESNSPSMNIIEPQTTPSGGTIWLNTSKVPLHMPDGEILGILGVYADITKRKQAEDALAHQTQFLRLLIDTIPLPIFYKDEQGHYFDCNQAFLDFHGKKKDEVIGKTIDWLGKELAEKFISKDQELFRNPGVQSYETELSRGDGSRRALLVKKATFLKGDGTVGGLIGIFNDITEIKEAEKELRALASRMAEVEEEERQALARELHDQVCQNLAILGLTMESLKMRARKEPLDLLLSRIGEISNLVEQTGEVTRELMEGLRPTVLDHYGLLEGLRRWGKQFSQRTGINVDVQGEEAAPRLAGAAELALFRIAQEALNNVAKHAQATRVVLSEVVDQDKVRLDIVDDGIGFDLSQARKPAGRHQWGLMTMNERAMTVGGQFHINSTPGAGTQVMVEVSR